MSIKLTVLGSGDAFNSAGRAHSCYWIDDVGGAFTVDFGPTALMQCKRLGKDPKELDAIFLTHLHGDHIGGLAVLLIELQYRAMRTRPLTIGGPPGTFARLDLLMRGAYPDVWGRGLRFPLRSITWDIGGTVEVLGRRVRAELAEHDREGFACSLRVETDGKILAFSGDTGWHEGLVGLVAGAEVFICECTEEVTAYASHLGFDKLSEVRSRLDVRRVIATHFGEAARLCCEERGPAAGIETADDGLVLEI